MNEYDIQDAGGLEVLAQICGQSRFHHSLFILQLLALLSLPTLCNSIVLIFDNSRQCSDVMVASGSAATLSEYELWSLQRASHSSKPKKASLSIVRMT